MSDLIFFVLTSSTFYNQSTTLTKKKICQTDQTRLQIEHQQLNQTITSLQNEKQELIKKVTVVDRSDDFDKLMKKTLQENRCDISLKKKRKKKSPF